MTENLFVENPYSAPADIVRAELAEPRRPAKKRHVGLAIVFLLLDLVMLIPMTGLLGWAIARCFETPRHYFAIPAVTCIAIAEAPLLLVAIMCLKEFVQAIRGR